MNVKYIKSGVYLANEEKSNKYKVGSSNDIDKRIKQLQTGNSSKLILYEWFPTENLFEIEGLAHKYADKNKIHGEWYEFTLDEVEDLCNFINKTIMEQHKSKITKIEIKENKQKININSSSYKCNECKFSTNKRTDYNRHIKTSKHEKNIEYINIEQNNEYICKYCNNSYLSQKGLTKHRNKCSKNMKLLAKKNELIKKQLQIKSDNEKIEIYKHLIKSHIDYYENYGEDSDVDEELYTNMVKYMNKYK